MALLVSVCLLGNAPCEQLQWLAWECYLVENQNAVHRIVVNGSVFRAHAFVLSSFGGPLCPGSKLNRTWRGGKKTKTNCCWTKKKEKKKENKLIDWTKTEGLRIFWNIELATPWSNQTISGPTDPKRSDAVTHFYDEQIYFPYGMYITKAAAFFRNNSVIDFSYATAQLPWH